LEGPCIRLTLPYPPSVNRLYGFSPKTGRRFMYREGKEFIESVKRIGQQAGIVPTESLVVFSFWLYRPRKIGDLMNIDKALADALEGIFYVNDRQIVEHHAYLRDDKNNPRVEVEVRPL